MPQFLFDGLIKNNICYPNKEPIQESLLKAARDSQSMEFIEKLFDNEDYYSLKMPYLPILKDEWYKLYIVDTRENEISRNSFRLKRTRKDHQKNYKLFY